MLFVDYIPTVMNYLVDFALSSLMAITVDILH